MKKLLALALCVVSCSASAELYRCVQNGKVLITGEPCPYGAKSTVIAPDAAPQESAEISPAEELARLKQKATELEQERLARNKVYDEAEAARRDKKAGAEEEADNEPVNAQGRLNVARKKREAAQQQANDPKNNQNNSGGSSTGGDSAGNTGKSGNSSGLGRPQ
ncbi:MAG: DUF4124 domain-containing protein [Zoogloeaceae bacterium]|jgi:hypothetical protein|nr:DUF4124 domain-containing protein [Zoogloeaceae bacterium]